MYGYLGGDLKSVARFCLNLFIGLGVSEQVLWQGMLAAKRGSEAAEEVLSRKRTKIEALEVSYYAILANQELKLIATAYSNNTVDDDLRLERLKPPYIVEKRREGEAVELVFYELVPEDYDLYRQLREERFRREFLE